ncbi:hypothetical protein RHABOEDO_001229 [Candidatus Rhabdochlamydia oedothoracis]|uniref:Uncharacterized protein n=1 Tax=Candidatus Rhabdochlamydia oedothoracis TaxID=2720720 RepID=A0ABX8V1B8_9BACT|nr:hypothetical protein RHABOEDO_001229 [Candidatus Rhabdochlamydia oedothoracis]
MLGCTIDVFSSIYMFFFVHFKVERATDIIALAYVKIGSILVPIQTASLMGFKSTT